VAVDRTPEEAEGGTTSIDPLAGTVFALLVLACFAAFFVTQRLKHTPTVVQRFDHSTAFSPSSPGYLHQEHISFRLASADEVTVTIIDSGGNTVATLVRDHPVPRYKPFSLRWNGRRGTARAYGEVVTPRGYRSLVPYTLGSLAPAGEYRVRVHLRRQNRTVTSPWTFSLVDG